MLNGQKLQGPPTAFEVNYMLKNKNMEDRSVCVESVCGLKVQCLWAHTHSHACTHTHTHTHACTRTRTTHTHTLVPVPPDFQFQPVVGENFFTLSRMK